MHNFNMNLGSGFKMPDLPGGSNEGPAGSGMKMDKEQMKKLIKSPMMQGMMGEQEVKEMEKLLEDDKMVNQMAGFWKQLDEMSSSDKKGYDSFIEKQMKDMQEAKKKEIEEMEAKLIIQSKPICSIKIRCVKIIEQKKQKNLTDSIKLFDFNKNAEISESLFTDANSKPLDQPKLYLNLVHHEKVLSPLNKDKKIADKLDDTQWHVIPIAFGPPKERWSGSGMKCIHVDGHVNTCVFELFKTSTKKIESITSYILLKFQHMLKDHYIFHKKSIKILTKKRYKPWRPSKENNPEDFPLPATYHIDHFEKAQKAIEDHLKELDIGQPKKEVQLTSKISEQKEEEQITNLIMPGKQETKKSVQIVDQSNDKYIPNTSVVETDENLIITFFVEEEKSAKDFQIDVSSQVVKLESNHYEYTKKFDRLDPQSVKAKFNKKDGTLKLTINKI